MPEDEPDKKRPLANLARILIGAGLPTLGAAVGGPVGAVVASEVARRVTGNKAADPETTVAALTAAGSGTAELFAKLQEMEMNLRAKQLEAITAEGEQLTERLRIDTASESWLARNVRPGGFAVTLVCFLLFAFVATFWMAPERFQSAEYFGGLLERIVGMYLSFYVGARTVEKVTSLFKKGGSDA